MRTMKQRALALMLSFLLVFSTLPVNAFATEVEATEESTETSSDDSLKLTDLQIAVGGNAIDNAVEQTITPDFDGAVTEYSTPVLDYISSSSNRYVWVKASATDGATVTAKCGNSEVAALTSGEWTIIRTVTGSGFFTSYSGCLTTGSYNKVVITVSAEGKEDKVYTVTVPVQPDLDNQTLAWKTNLADAIYYTKGADSEALTVEAEYKNRPLENEEVIAYQWYSNTTNSTENGTKIEDAVKESYNPQKSELGTTYYYVVASCKGMDSITSNVIGVTVTDKKAPASITISCDYPYTIPDTWANALGGKNYIAKTGETLQLKAVDENGDETPVTWDTSGGCYGGTLDKATGLYTITSTSYSYVKAVSLYDSSIKSDEKVIVVKDYAISQNNKTPSVNLSTDGQSFNTISTTGGVSGYTIWTYKMSDDNIAELKSDLTKKANSIQFTALRPGTIEVSFDLDLDGDGTKDGNGLSDTAVLTINGVAVEDSEETLTKTYLEVNGETAGADQEQLKAYVADGRTVASWTSSNEEVATVDETGKVTAKKAGIVTITATDSEGTKGGIKVVVEDANTPYFENIAFTTGNLWTDGLSKNITFDMTTTEYTGLQCTKATTSWLQFAATTLYNTEKYTAEAEYTDINGEKQTVAVNSGSVTKLDTLPFGTTVITVTLTSKKDATIKTVYTFEVTRPRDTSNQLNYRAGIALSSDVRALLTNKYNNKAEGQLFRTDAEGVWDGTNTYSFVNTYYNYRAWLQDGLENFKLTVKGYTNYVHLRYSTDNGETWKELAQGGGTTASISFPERTGEDNPVVKVMIQGLDDKTYTANVEAGKDGFAEGTMTTYTVWVEQLPVSGAEMLTAEVDGGDFYPEFASDRYSYTIVIPKGAEAPTLTYTVSDETTVTVDNVEQTAVDGKYTLKLTTTLQDITLTRKGGTKVYSFRYSEKVSNDSPDKIIDYLPINSQYTNGLGGGYGVAPYQTFTAGGLVSLGNFGGYITYYYENALTDDPNNKYGVDFYVYGNAFKDTSTGTGLGSMEPGQVWVSEDGENWYALAGSEHYEDSTLWDYEVTYSKTETGMTSWTDNCGNKDNGTQVGQWPLISYYPWNTLLENDTITLSGILLPCVDGSLTGNGTFASFSKGAKFGYVDTMVNSAEGEDANPYLENDNYELKSSGFDLAWAVDTNGDPIDVTGKEFHYVKIVTASNLWAGAANEKSTEVATVLRTTAQEEAVGTSKAAGVTISGAGADKEVVFEDGKQVYEVNLGSMKYISLNVTGTSEDANIYVNNQRVEAGEAATGIKVTQEDGVKLVRIIVQDGDKEPAIYLLKLTSEASAVNDLIDDVKVDVNGVTKSTVTKDGETFTTSVTYRIENISITPVLASEDVTYTINGEEPKESYALKDGENTFTIEAVKGDITDTATVIVTKEETPESTGEITVYFTLLGDDQHGDNGEKHTLANGNLDTWIAKTAYTLDTPCVVLDLMDIALAGKYEFVNSGNYISKVGDLAEFDNGATSGWMYTINGVHSDLGIAEQSLADGDVIVFHYTDDYTSESYDEVVSSEYVEQLIDAIGTVTLQSSADISAARAAYDKLSEEEKADVSNYEVLVAAEEKLAELIEELKATLKELDDIYATTGKYLVDNVTDPTIASIAGEWAVLGLARAGYEVPEDYFDTYVKNVLAIMEENDGVLSGGRKYTEYERLILALTSIGYDVTDVAEYNLLDYMADYDKVVWQGINSVAFALIALDSHDYEIPEAAEGKTQTTREKLIAYLLDAQLEDNGWALSGTKADTDVTAMVLQALDPYYGKNVEVTAAVNKALVTLSELQGEDGYYINSDGSKSAESNAQVVVALTALGINPDTDERFIKGGTSVLDALGTFYVSGGGFSHVLGGKLDGMATEQGYYALVSYYRLMNDQTSLYDMTDVTIQTQDPEVPGEDSQVPGENPEVPGQTTGGSDEENTKPEQSGGSTATGDDSFITMYAVAAIMAVAAAGVLGVKRKKEY